MQINVVYNAAVKRKYPEAVSIAIAKDRNGTPNPITLGWAMFTSHKPPMLAISVGLSRYSVEAIRHAGEFVLAFPRADMAEAARYYGTVSGRNSKKLEEQPVRTEKAMKVDSVLLADAAANFECKLVSEHKTGDHIIFTGEVIASHINEDESVGRLFTLSTGFVMGPVSY
jgi:flavin reductase (DIM6/NTAB) family NADH-FMN oxidoreductase RutF